MTENYAHPFTSRPSNRQQHIQKGIPRSTMKKEQHVSRAHRDTPEIIEISDDEEDEDNNVTALVATNRPVVTHQHPRQAARLPPLRAVVGNAMPAAWPRLVVNLAANFNPNGIRFPFLDHFGMCGCTTPCRFQTCMNASLGTYCARNNCPFKGHCGNGLRQSHQLQLMRNPITEQYFLRATSFIERGVVIGEYLGLLTLENRFRSVINRGYRLQMRHASVRPCHRVFIDARVFGSLMRFLNHSCDASARFHEMANGRHHTVVVVTTRDIRRGEEVTVDYGPNLWFNCSCGRPTCRHRVIDA